MEETMKLKLFALLVLAGSSTMFAGPRFSVAFGFGHAAPPPVAMYAPPPPPAYGYVAPAPGPGYGWAGGYRYSNDPHWAERSGYWTRPAYRNHWVAPRYEGHNYDGYSRRH